MTACPYCSVLIQDGVAPSVSNCLTDRRQTAKAVVVCADVPSFHVATLPAFARIAHTV